MSTPWSVFQDGRMGSPQPTPRARSTGGTPNGARFSPRSQSNDVSTGITTTRALAAAAIRVGPHPESIGGPAHHRSASDRGASPPPSASSRQFQALFDSLFKVLFIFPLAVLVRYRTLAAFSLGRNLPPDGAAFPNNPTR
ncbi:hypothetical protein Syun_006798 [Stephania yunnanensis]|uniref:Uncharacterized protein n=1 Tax=Stephania yunnanensis TaxID=152371 RepID=A0AAP0KYZ4_9MAGN